jgi:transcriptional regulator with XRE-family HTH domain
VKTQVSRNVRFMLWLRELPRIDWIKWVSDRTGLSLATCRELLMDTTADDALKPAELRALSRAFDLADDGSDLRYSDFLGDSGRSVLAENLKYLFNSLEHGGKKQLARSFGVDPTTVSRWLAGTSEPQGPGMRQIVSHFGLPPDTDLRQDPVFLSLEPISFVEKRDWVRDRVDNLSQKELQQLYPALRRMLKGE